jgi:hypothetical protein
LTQEKGFDGPNFITLGKISKDEQIEIIKLDFQLQGYNIKYKSIRRTKLYQQLKE